MQNTGKSYKAVWRDNVKPRQLHCQIDGKMNASTVQIDGHLLLPSHIGTCILQASDFTIRLEKLKL